MISAVFRRGGDVSFVVDEMKAVFDPRGGYWMHGRYVPSLLAAIGEVIENHMIEIGFLAPDRKPGPREAVRTVAVAGGEPEEDGGDLAMGGAALGLRQCRRCGAAAVVHQEGCDTCTACGWSHCG